MVVVAKILYKAPDRAIAQQRVKECVANMIPSKRNLIAGWLKLQIEDTSAYYFLPENHRKRIARKI
ncbi:MAG: hypothetical protein Kow00108_05650 [Calditrichia bacterium]